MTVEDSYRHCRTIARRRARNFYYSFLLLDPVRRNSLSAVYAFMRHCDDLSDQPGATLEAIEQWRRNLGDALSGNVDGHPLWPAFVDTVRRYRIPEQYFHDMIDGVSSDLRCTRRSTFDELYRYCYRVASVAGMSVVHVFGHRTPEALPLAEKCGVAFQLTNIIRDVREDWELGRVYLPQEDLRRFGVEDSALAAATVSPALRQVLRLEAARARDYYRESRPLLDMVDPSCRKSLWAMIEIYSGVLHRMETLDFEVLRQRVRLSAIEKCAILARALVAPW